MASGLVCLPMMARADKPADADRPNIVWFMMEDVSPDFVAAYNDGVGATMPNFRRLAEEGLIFDNAYSCAPVSSAARSTLITGRYAPSLGLGYHRTFVHVRLPQGTSMFPSLLRRAGYHTANSAKTDYNCMLDSAAWDIVKGRLGDWRQRPTPDTPFFFVRTNAACHESCLHFTDTTGISDSGQQVKFLPQNPPTPLMRKSYLQFYQSLDICDAELGKLLDMLGEDGLLDNTIVFCFGDNGGSLPGTKGYVTEGGLKVPLAVRIPKKYRERWGIEAGSHISGVVDFTDFAATALHLAACEIPDWIDGMPFLGEGITPESVNAADETLGYADRFDELYAYSRTLRKGSYKYVRNYYPYAPASLMATYRYRQLAFAEWRDMFGRGELDSVQARFFLPQGPEALYDLASDPGETRNLAPDPAYASILADMRSLLESRLDALNDVGPLTEHVLQAEADGCPGEYGPRISGRLRRLRAIADMQTAPFTTFQDVMASLLQSSDEAERYWGAVNAIWFIDKFSPEAISGLLAALSAEQTPAVKSKMLTAAIIAGRADISAFTALMGDARSEPELLMILNDMAYLHESLGYPVWHLPAASSLPFDSEPIQWRLTYLRAASVC